MPGQEPSPYRLGQAPLVAAPARAPGTDDPLTLERAATGLACRVTAVRAARGALDWERWLAEIGFLPGESVKVSARGLWRDGPLVVRIGDSTFALRRAEAACVEVEPL
jgi:ferrous iron transport protein A